jgi:hypothetical protein
LIRVPPGWTAEAEGYFLNAEALSSLTAAAKTYRLEREAWETAYYELYGKANEFRRSTEELAADLRRQIDEERAARRAEIRRARNPGFGVFAGVGYAGGGGAEAVVGVGLVWKIF